MRVHFLQLLEQAGVELWIDFHLCEFILIVLRVFIKNLTEKDQLSQHVKFIWIPQLEVLLLIVKEEVEQIMARVEGVQLGFHSN